MDTSMLGPAQGEPNALSMPGEDATAAMRQLIMGFRTTQMIHVAAKLGVSDLLHDGPQDAHALARAVDADPDALHRLLRALASVGIYSQSDDGRFGSSALSETLRSEVPGSLRQLAVLYGESWLWQAYGNTVHAVRTGRDAFRHTHGESVFDYLQRQPRANKVFADAMSGYTRSETSAILEAHDFTRYGSVLDVGGGHGALMLALLDAHPGLEGAVFDLEATLAGTCRAIGEAGVRERCKLFAGDFFTEVTAFGDLLILKSVLHDWNDEQAVQILRNCRTAMQPGARLLIAERLLPEDCGASEAKLFDINMLVVAGGRERSEREYRALLEAAGFALERVIGTASPLCLLEAAPKLRSTTSGVREGGVGPGHVGVV